MNRNIRLLLTVSLLSIMPFSAPSIAQQKNQQVEESDYQLERRDNGYVRLNRKTGKTSYCRFVSDDLVCNVAIEERDALYQEISELQDQIAALQKEFDQVISRTEQKLQRPEKDVPNPQVNEGAGSERDEIEQEVDKAIDITKRTMRKLFRAVKDLQKELESE